MYYLKCVQERRIRAEKIPFLRVGRRVKKTVRHSSILCATCGNQHINICRPPETLRLSTPETPPISSTNIAQNKYYIKQTYSKQIHAFILCQSIKAPQRLTRLAPQTECNRPRRWEGGKGLIIPMRFISPPHADTRIHASQALCVRACMCSLV